MSNDLNNWLSDFFEQYPGLTDEQRAIVQRETNEISELVAANEQAAIDAEVEAILLASL